VNVFQTLVTDRISRQPRLVAWWRSGGEAKTLSEDAENFAQVLRRKENSDEEHSAEMLSHLKPTKCPICSQGPSGETIDELLVIKKYCLSA
jgi:hypothetical protein